MTIEKDKIMHFAACAIIAALVALLFVFIAWSAPAACLAGFVAAVGVGVGKEYGDSLAPGNHFCWHDLTADAIGALVGCLTGLLALI